MIGIAKTIGRLIAVLVDAEIIERKKAAWILEPLKDKTENEDIEAMEQEPMLDKIKDEIEKQEKWLLQAGYNAYNVDIAFSSIISVLAESEPQESEG